MIPEDVKFFQWPARKLEEVWPMIKPYVKAVIERLQPKLTGERFVNNVLSGKWQLWVAWVPADRKVIAFMITELEQYDNGDRAAHMVIVTGDHREKWQDLALQEVEKWAIEEGCVALSGWCRPGWEGLTRQHGFKRTHVLIEKKLVRKEVKPKKEIDNGRIQGRRHSDGHAEIGSMGEG